MKSSAVIEYFTPPPRFSGLFVKDGEQVRHPESFPAAPYDHPEAFFTH
jgi:hypothetical protein